ncbi:dihydroorotase [Granulosicoccaceae sp. 1_MG-2023]|nr:dihydroorotase [Granulosicoccaceae sp. 1_MG-2023]
MSSVRIDNIRLLDPSTDTEAPVSLGIRDALIVDSDTLTQPDTVIDGSGLTACPGLIDLYARLREPGHEKKGTIASETRAALHGGVTSVVCSPDTDPVIDESATVELINRRAADAGAARVLPLAALTQKLDGQQISELATLRDAGCVAASNADKPIANAAVLRSIMEYAATFDIRLHLVAQEASLSNNGVMHEGFNSTRMGLIGIPVAAESVALGMIMELAGQTGASVHFSRITSARGIDLIRDAKHRGLPVTADTSINHLLLTDNDTLGFNSLCHVVPPLRSPRDQQALRDAIADGTLDAICTDHAPLDPDSKLAPFPATSPGISGLDIFLPLLIKLADETALPLRKLIRLASRNPAQIIGREPVRLQAGSVADIVLFDAEESFICNSAEFVSKGHNSPYHGLSLRGRVKHCIIDGKHLPLGV